MNYVIFRQNTEGLYAGVEWTNPPANVWAALETHPKMKAFRHIPRKDLAISTRIMSRNPYKRIIRMAKHSIWMDYAA